MELRGEQAIDSGVSNCLVPMSSFPRRESAVIIKPVQVIISNSFRISRHRSRCASVPSPIVVAAALTVQVPRSLVRVEMSLLTRLTFYLCARVGVLRNVFATLFSV